MKLVHKMVQTYFFTILHFFNFIYLIFQEVEAYKRYLRDAALQLGGTSHEAGIFSEAIFGFEKRIVENLPDMSTSDPLQQYNRMTVVDLKNLAPAVSIIVIF